MGAELAVLERVEKRATASGSASATTAGEAELRLMFDDSEEGEYDMRLVLKREKEKGKKKHRGKVEKEDAFRVDLSDNRFASLLEGDSKFGLDPTSSDFKATGGMKDILKEQQKRRKKHQHAQVVEERAKKVARGEGQDVSVSGLASKLKDKMNGRGGETKCD